MEFLGVNTAFDLEIQIVLPTGPDYELMESLNNHLMSSGLL